MDKSDRLTKVYQLFVDSPNDTVPKETLKDLFSYAGYVLTEEDLQNIVNYCPEEGMNLDTFTECCSKLEEKEISREEFEKCLRSLTDENSSLIDANTLIAVLDKGKYKLNDEEIEELVGLSKPDAEGKISIDYLLNLIYNEE